MRSKKWVELPNLLTRRELEHLQDQGFLQYVNPPLISDEIANPEEAILLSNSSVFCLGEATLKLALQ